MYAEGGIISVTSRILVVDLLSKLLDPETVTGLLILHADKIIATSVEAFIVRIYRQFNKIGFLKAFSDSPEPFVSGFAPLANMLRNLFLRKPSLWPRFHVTVAQSLEGKKKAEVIELEVPMTESMKDIQNAILECVEVSIGELKKANSGLEMEDWTLDSALHRNFDVIIRRQLDPVWHRVSWRTKQIVGDLTVLRSILHSLLSYDCVSFVKYLDTVLSAHSPPPGSTRLNQSPWLFLDAANTIFQSARSRVYSGKVDDVGILPTSNLPDTLRPVLEEQPKWEVLSDILDEIERENYFNPAIRDDSSGTILIMCNDQPTCRQVREYLQTMHLKAARPEQSGTGQAPHEEEEEAQKPSGEFMLRRKLREYLGWKRTFAQVSASLFEENQKSLNGIKETSISNNFRGRAPPNKRRRTRGGGTTGTATRTANGAVSVADEKAAQVAHLLAELQPSEHERLVAQEDIPPDDDLPETCDSFFELYNPDDTLVVHPYDADMDDNLLEEIRPRYIIMYSPSSDFIRRVEVYRSSHTDRSVRVYFTYYGGSVEEQRYLSSVRREKDAFTKLIRERGSMAITLNDPGPQEAGDAATAAFLRTVNTRIAGGGRLSATAATPTVIVDVREFRSALPSLLHARGVAVIPCQLTVADYVLAPEICVERKSVGDLVASFKNGRLFHQAESMQRYYRHFFLLIEFDRLKAFTLDPFAEMVGKAGAGGGGVEAAAESRDLQAKLVLLTLAFPRLKIIWSSSPFQSAEIVAEIKKNNEEPDPVAAVRVGLVTGEGEGEGGGGGGDGSAAAAMFNPRAQELLRCVPGVDAGVAERLVLKVRDVREVAGLSVEELDPEVGGEVGRRIWKFFNRSVFDGG